MTRKVIADAIYEHTGCTKDRASIAAAAIVDDIASALIAGEEVSLRGLGTLKTVIRSPRTCRNPQTGEPIEVGERVTVKFKPSANLKADLN